MDLLLAGGMVYQGGTFVSADVAVSDGRIVSVSPNLPRGGYSVVEVNDCWIFPGFVDVHVHLREPGFSYKETVETGTAAAAAGGYTTVCAMPNLNPVPDSAEHLRQQLDIIQRDAKIWVIPYGAITVGEKGEKLADLEAMAPDVAGFSDDGRGVQSDDMARAAMELAKKLERPYVAHCEVNDLLIPGGCVHAGKWAAERGIPGISSESEWKMIERDIGLVREIGCQYHVCHISTKESVELIRKAKAEGLPVTCETGPHYLVMCDEELQDEGRFKMNPPIRSAEDRDALVAGLLDGTIDCIATDHAPHSAEEKSRGVRGSAFGIVGLETAFPVLYTKLVEPGIVPLEVILDRLCTRPREIFRLPAVTVEAGCDADLTVIAPGRTYTVRGEDFCSKGKATPFEGWQMHAAVAATVCGGELVYNAL